MDIVELGFESVNWIELAHVLVVLGVWVLLPATNSLGYSCGSIQPGAVTYSKHIRIFDLVSCFVLVSSHFHHLKNLRRKIKHTKHRMDQKVLKVVITFYCSGNHFMDQSIELYMDICILLGKLPFALALVIIVKVFLVDNFILYLHLFCCCY
jgi:hypothetical protein